MNIPVGEQMLSRHMLLLGGIGTGKSNAFNFLIRNVRANLTDRDVVVIFDTKGDFYHEFYRPGDVVISNDARADGGSGPDYWNLFGEVTIDDRVEENILEIAKSFFAEKLEHTTQPFFPNAAKDLFSALLLHMVRSEQFRDFRNNQALRSTFDTFSVPAMKTILQSHRDLKAMTSYIEDEKSGQTLGVVAELQQMVREIFVGNFRKKGTLSMRQLIRNKGGRVIFVEYDLGIGGMLTPGLPPAHRPGHQGGALPHLERGQRVLLHRRVPSAPSSRAHRRRRKLRPQPGRQVLRGHPEHRPDRRGLRREHGAQHPLRIRHHPRVPGQRPELEGSTSSPCSAATSSSRPTCPPCRTAACRNKSARGSWSRTRTSRT